MTTAYPSPAVKAMPAPPLSPSPPPAERCEDDQTDSMMSSLQLDSTEMYYPDSDFDHQGFVRNEFGLDCVSFELFHSVKSVVENGQLVETPAKRCVIFLKDEPPEGCDKESFHMQFLEKVTSNPTDAYYKSSAFNNTVFEAILTQDEYSKLNGMDELEKAVQCYDGVALY